LWKCIEVLEALVGQNLMRGVLHLFRQVAKVGTG